MALNRALVTAIALATFVTPGAAQERVVVAGRVVGGEGGTPVAGAEVELNGRMRMSTSSDGRFRFADVVPGPALIHVRMLGFDDAEVQLVLRSDTTLEIRLTEQAIRLDPIEAVARLITIRGRVTDPVNRLGVDGTVFAYPGGRRDDTNFTGRYRIDDVPATDSTRLTVAAFGYLRESRIVDAAGDTAVDFVMTPDTIVSGIIERMIERISDRTSAAIAKVEARRAEDFNQTGTIFDVLRYQYHLNTFGCIVWDDDPRRRFHVIPLPHEVQLIEIIGRRGVTADMVRIYTKEYFRMNIGSSRPLATLTQRRNSRVECPPR